MASCTKSAPQDEPVTTASSSQPTTTEQPLIRDEERAARLAERIARFPSCPVTEPNGSAAPGVLVRPVGESSYYGHAGVWTGLWPDGIVYFFPDGPGTIDDDGDGTLAMKFWFWRAVPGDPLTLEGRRLDDSAPPLRSHIPAGYDSYFQATSLIFTSEGCWEVTAETTYGSMTFVVLVINLN